jgi:hypothetical protein
MKKLFAFAAMLLAFGSNVFAEGLTAEETRWVQAVTPFYNEAKEAGINVSIAVATDQENGKTPVALGYRSPTKQCVFIVAVRGNVAARWLESRVKTMRGPVVARITSAAHEYGHCLQHLAAAETGGVANGYAGTQVEAKEEALGDVFALAWIAKNLPEDFATAHRFLVELRSSSQVEAQEQYNILDVVLKARELPQLMAKNPDSPFDIARNVVYGTPLASARVQVAAATIPAAVETK